MATWQTPMFRELAEPLVRLLGDKTAKPLRAMGLETLHDLLRHLPRHLMSGADLTDIGQIMRDYEKGTAPDHVAILARIVEVAPKTSNGKHRLEVTIGARPDFLRITFFGKPHLIAYWQGLLSRSQVGLFSGKLGWFRDQPQLNHPDFVMLMPDGSMEGGQSQMTMAKQVRKSSFLGIYPQTSAIKTWTISECEDLALERIVGIPDAMPAWVRDEAELLDFEEACRAVHQPASREEHAAGVRRLIFDEAFATQVAMAYRRADTRRHLALARPRRAGGLLDAFDARLPFALTEQQESIGDEIFAALDSRRPMQRLLQGEVGSGKTVVALRAMLAVVDAGGQAVLLAPTEVLAQQHYLSVTALLGDLALGQQLGAAEHATEVVLLTGSAPAAAKRTALAQISSGEAGIVIGTHALLEERVEPADLGLVVVDEQHRFGVEQRNALGSRVGHHPHVLVMTATPIPRSVAMTVFGDLDVSTLTELPRGRADVSTTVVDTVRRQAWVDRAWQRVVEEVSVGRQAFVICPAIGGKDATEGVAAVEDVVVTLAEGPLSGLRVEKLHGRMPADAKTETMRRYAAGEIDVLVATTVVEVGVDVPNASVMVVLDADRYGISQLHQLRGRIGRGAYPGVCLLLTAAEPGTTARERLDAVAATRDGFALSEVDLAQRREGDVLGRSQSGGRSSLRLLRVLEHADDIAIARTLAERVVAQDPDLTDPGIRDYVTTIDRIAEGEWQEST